MAIFENNEPKVLKGIDLVVEPGETRVIIGPSGGGKTMLMKIMLGLLDPTAGEVRVDGIPLTTYGKAALSPTACFPEHQEHSTG